MEGVRQECTIVYSTGFFIEFNYDALKVAAQFCQDHGKLFGFNLAAEYLFKSHPQRLLEMIKKADIIYCNKDEALACGEELGEYLGLEQ